MRLRLLAVPALTLAASTAWGAVAGRVLAPDGSPLAGASVTAYAPETLDEQLQRLYAGRARAPLATTRSDAQGGFRLEAGPLVHLVAHADGFAPSFASGSAEEPVTFELKEAKAVRGVVRAAGRPVAGARVAWLGHGYPRVGEWTAVTAADGSYDVPDPRAWASQVVVLHPDFAPLDSQDDDRQASSPPLDRELDAGAPLAGTVVDEAGRPVRDASLWIGGSLWWPMAATGADGTFRVARAPRKWRTVSARTRSLAGTVQRRPGPVTVVMRPGRVLVGTVREAPGGRPLAGASVSVARSDGSADYALTDAAGAYRLDGLPAGRHYVSALRAGYVASPHAADTADLRAALQARHDVALIRQPVVRGRVVDETRSPVEGARVMPGFKGTAHIYAPDPFQALSQEGAAVRTRADGSFTLAVPAARGASFPGFEDRPLIVLKPGYAAARAALTASPASQPVLITLSRGIELRGRVRRADGSAVAGASLTLVEDGSVLGSMIPSHFLIAHTQGEGWTRTAADGTFTTRVHPAVHHLAFRAPGLAPAVVRGHDPRAGQPLDVVMQPAAVLRGRVLRHDGRGVADVVVTAEQDSLPETTATTGADGTFELTDLAAGTYKVTAVQLQLGLQITRTIEAPDGDVQLVLEPSGTIRGRVIDGASRRPVTAFRLSFSWAGTPGQTGGTRQAEVEDPAGAFAVADVPARAVTVWATAEGYATGRVEDVSVPAGPDGVELDIVLEADAPIRGRVTAEDRSPVPEAIVRASAAGSEQQGSARVDEDGAFELRGVAAGEVSLTVQAEGFLPEKRALDTRQGARVDVVLRRGLALAGVVTADGAPQADATVSASSSAAGAQHVTAQSDARGQFRLEGLVPGRYAVSAQAEGKGRARLENVDPESSGALRLVLERPRVGTITGKVVGLAPGEEPTFGMVLARGEEGENGTALIDATGGFRMEDAPAGRVSVAAHASMGESASRTSRSVDLTLAAGAEVEVVLEFTGDVVSGLVTREGRPVPGILVSFTGAGRGPSAGGRTDTRGVYEVAGLEAGRYAVTVSDEASAFTTEYVVSGSGQFDIDITGGGVQGRVLHSEGGAPLVGVDVTLWPLGAKENRPAGSAATNAQGEFALRSREGRYRVVTSKKGFGQEAREVEVARGATASLLVELSPAAGVGVTVVDARDGRALEATVVVRDAARRIVANSHSGVDDDGTLNIPLADGSYLLSTSAAGYGTATLPVTSPSQGVRVPLTPGGTVVIESAQDQEGRVRLLQPDGEEYVQCWCNGIAEIELHGRRTVVEHVTPGSYTLEVLREGTVAARRPVVVHEGQKTTVSLD